MSLSYDENCVFYTYAAVRARYGKFKHGNRCAYESSIQ